jgi:hypothetical protein
MLFDSHFGFPFLRNDRIVLLPPLSATRSFRKSRIEFVRPFGYQLADATGRFYSNPLQSVEPAAKLGRQRELEGVF